MKKTERKAAVIPVRDLHPFEGNPYKVREGEELDALAESIQGAFALAGFLLQDVAFALLAAQNLARAGNLKTLGHGQAF